MASNYAELVTLEGTLPKWARGPAVSAARLIDPRYATNPKYMTKRAIKAGALPYLLTNKQKKGRAGKFGLIPLQLGPETFPMTATELDIIRAHRVARSKQIKATLKGALEEMSPELLGDATQSGIVMGSFWSRVKKTAGKVAKVGKKGFSKLNNLSLAPGDKLAEQVCMEDIKAHDNKITPGMKDRVIKQGAKKAETLPMPYSLAVKAAWPQHVARAMKKLSKQYGEGEGDIIDQVVERAQNTPNWVYWALGGGALALVFYSRGRKGGYKKAERQYAR